MKRWILGAVILAMAPNHMKTNINDLHSKALCCDGLKQVLDAGNRPCFLVF